MAAEIAKYVVDKTELVLRELAQPGGSDDGRDLPSLETRLHVSGLLDLLSQLVMAFPKSEEVVRDVKKLALKLIQTANKKEFRNKAVRSELLFLFFFGGGVSDG
jgi:hypothetical protein